MRLNKKRNLEYYTFSNFDQHLRHGIFTRKGGISPTPWEALNVGSTVGDEPDRVLQNRSSLFETLELDISRVYECWQVHGTKVILAEGPREYINPLKKADAIITNKQGLSLLMRFADCVPILLFDRKLKVIGIIHAGWKGTVNNIAEVAVKSMVHAYGSNPKDIIAGIGPSIGPDHYEVGEDVIKKVESVYGMESKTLINQDNGKIHFDLWEANRINLAKSGIKDIELAGICTACNLSDWYSHRAENGRTGRFGAIISL